MRLLGDLHVRRIRRQHPCGNLQTLPGGFLDRDRAVSAFGFADNLKAEAVEWVERIENTNVLGFCASGYCECGYHHPHLHCVVPGGGLSPDGTRWISCRPGFFLPVRVLSRLFRRLFLKYLEKTFDAGRLQFFGSLEKLAESQQFRSYLAPLELSEWVVYAKPPFAGPQKVLDYVGRYTHRVAISNNRLLDV